MTATSQPSNLTSSTVLVMGGSGVLGRAICLRFAEAQWTIGLHYHRNKKEAQKLVSRLQEHGATDSEIFPGDVEDPRQVQSLINRVYGQWGKIDAFIWAVGTATNALTLRMSVEQWDTQIDINLTGLFYGLRTIGPIFLNQGFGSAMVLSSLASMRGGPGQAAYAAAKAGALGLVKTAAQEWGGTHIRVNAVFPGWHRSDLSGDAFPDPHKLEDHLLGRTPDIQEIANLIYHLTTAQDISGQIFNLDSRLW